MNNNKKDNAQLNLYHPVQRPLHPHTGLGPVLQVDFDLVNKTLHPELGDQSLSHILKSVQSLGLFFILHASITKESLA